MANQFLVVSIFGQPNVSNVYHFSFHYSSKEIDGQEKEINGRQNDVESWEEAVNEVRKQINGREKES